MDLADELISVLEKAKETNDYFNPWIIQGVLNGISDGDIDADKKISKELWKWSMDMFSW